MKGSRCAWIGLLLCVLEGCHSTTPTPPTSPLPTPPPTPKEDSSEDASVQVVAAVIVGFLFIVGMLLYCWYSKNARRRKAKAAPQRDIGDEIAKAPILRTPEPSPQPRQHPLHPRVHVFQLNDRVLTSDGKRGTVTLLSPDNTYTVELDSGSMVLDSYPEDYLTAAPPLYQVGDRVLHDGERATVESVDGATYGIVTDNGNKVASVPEANLARAMKFKVGDIVLCTHPATKQVLVAVVTQADEATGRYVVKFESDGAIFEGIPEDELELAKEEFKEGDVVTAYNPKSGRVETGVVETVDGRNFTYTVRYHSDGLNTVPQHALQLHNGFLVGDRVVETASGRKGTVLGVLPEEGAYIISYDGTPGEGSTTPGVALMKDAVPSSIIITAAPQFNIGDVVASTSARKAGKVTQTDPLTVTWLNGKQQVVRDNEIALYNGFLPGDRVVATYTGTPVHGTVVKIKDKKGYYRVKWDDGRVREVHHSKLGTNMGPKHAVGDIVTAYNPETGTVETAVVTHLNATTQTYTVQYHSSGLVDTVPEHALEAYDGYLIGQRVATNKGNGPSRPGTVVGILDPVKGTYLIRHDDASSGHPKEVSAEWVSPLSPAAELTPSTPLLSSSMSKFTAIEALMSADSAAKRAPRYKRVSSRGTVLLAGSVSV
eukprot:TRINITY_DN19120_c0_g1_i1.p1 TRINITY_DN19120_c0_g1~~TRINITY_DN19120_c0_g1_i1.p1  ORF type:complete len:656 (+),score=152.68 TRINITY_DN19120_c0_g1_i1:65-2032(+)